MPAPAVAPYVPTYASYTPYITADDFRAEPTGVDVSQLIPSGSGLTEQAALERLVANASSEADRICQKVLAATLDVVAGQYRIQREGTIHVPVPFSPIISVNAVAVGCAAGNLTPLTDLSGVWIERSVAYIPVHTPRGGQFPAAGGARARPGWVFAQVGYVNGWAHSTLSASSDAGAQSIAPANALGFVPGLPVTIYDGQNTEHAQVADTYVPGSPTVPLASPLANAHAAGTTVSALPPFVRQAVIALAKWLAKTKGSRAIVMPTVLRGSTVSREGAKTQATEPGGGEDYKQAERDLLPLARVR